MIGTQYDESHGNRTDRATPARVGSSCLRTNQIPPTGLMGRPWTSRPKASNASKSTPSIILASSKIRTCCWLGAQGGEKNKARKHVGCVCKYDNSVTQFCAHCSFSFELLMLLWWLSKGFDNMRKRSANIITTQSCHVIDHNLVVAKLCELIICSEFSHINLLLSFTHTANSCCTLTFNRYTS